MAIKDIKFSYQKFEYTTSYFSSGNSLELELNGFGDQGWEVVGVWPQNIGLADNGIIVIFKRPKY